jgi:16S rRNA (guanine527-N7)-methyltransferase
MSDATMPRDGAASAALVPAPEAAAPKIPAPEASSPGAVFGRAAFAAATGATSANLARLDAYLEMLADWNSRMNLVGPSALTSFWLRHAYDSAQLLTLAPSAAIWADLGSGAGLPGIVLAILLKDRPGAQVHLVESMQKRVRFLAKVSTELNLPVTLHARRAEDMTAPKGLEVVTARACAPLSRLLSYAYPCLREGAIGLFLKGRDVEHELTEARLSWKFDARLHISLSDPSGRVLQLQKVTRV